MSYNGSGTFQINTSGQPVVAGTVISSTAFNALTADLATGLSTAITKDGQSTTTVRIPFAAGINSTLVTDSTGTTTGSIITGGGVGIAKALYVGTTANVAGAATLGSTLTYGGVTLTNAVTGTGKMVLDTSPTITGLTANGVTATLPVINNIKMGYSTTATAAGTTTLTVSSNYRQFFTGTLAQTIVLPVTSTLVTGMAYEIENNSTGLLTVNSSGGNLVGTIPAGVCAHAVCIGTTLTTAADWDWDYISTTTITGTGANVLGTSPTIATPTITGDASISGLTVGRGGGAVSTNTAVGASALAATATGNYNSGFGYQALQALTSGNFNTSIGQGTLSLNTSGSSNTALGQAALTATSTGSQNTGIGKDALTSNTTASNNTAVGYQAGYANTTGDGLVAVGKGALNSNTTGANGTAIGYQSLAANTTGNYNIAVGYNTLTANTTASGNNAFGHAALQANTTGASNTAVGFLSLQANTTASNNTAVGYQAGYNITTGANNACFGYIAGTDTVRNITTNSNEIVMGNNSHTAAYIKVAWTVTSDSRDKTSFSPVQHGLAFVNSLTPTAYQFRVSREDDTPTGVVRYGFKAQDILALEGANPVIINNSDPDNLKYNQDSMIAVLVNAIKELKAEIDLLKGASA